MYDESDKIIVAAIAAILLIDSDESVIKISPGRERGTAWSQDHTRISIGKTSLSKKRNQRSTLR